MIVCVRAVTFIVFYVAVSCSRTARTGWPSHGDLTHVQQHWWDRWYKIRYYPMFLCVIIGVTVVILTIHGLDHGMLGCGLATYTPICYKIRYYPMSL